MKSMVRGLLVGGVGAVAIAAGLIGCSTETQSKEEVGELGLPLASYGPSGARYRLRDAQFQIQSSYYWGGYAGTSSQPAGVESITVSSEEDPEGDSITVSLEQGSYNVTLLPGWRLEKVGPNGAETVDATLISSNTSYVYVSPRSTSWSEFHFGIGERSLWLNGKLNIDIRVSEDPNDPCANGSGYGGGWGYANGCNYGTGGAAGADGGETAGAAGTGAGGASF